MDCAEENSFRKSQLRPPSRIKSPGRPLSEVPEAQSNARSSAIPKPGMKRPQQPSFTNPEAKRKALSEKSRVTLVDQAGEYKPQIPTAASARPVVKGTSLVGNQTNTQSHKMGSAISAGGAIVSTATKPLATLHRYQQSFSRSTSAKPVNSAPKSRSMTAMENHKKQSTIDEEQRLALRQGMQLESSLITPPETEQLFLIRKIRPTQSMQSLNSRPSQGSKREISVSTAMSKLTISDGSPKVSESEHRMNHSARRVRSATPAIHKHSSHKTSISNGSRNLKKGASGDKAMVLFHPAEQSIVAPKTPSQIPVLSKSGAVAATPATPCKNSKQSKPSDITPFLTKDSNVPAFDIEWDLKGRLNDMESMYFELKGTMKDSIKDSSLDRNVLEEAVTLYKSQNQTLEEIIKQTTTKSQNVQSELETTRQRLTESAIALDKATREHRDEVDRIRREHRDEVDSLRRDHGNSWDTLMRNHREEIYELERRKKAELEEKVQILENKLESKLEEERNRRLAEIADIERRYALESAIKESTNQQQDLTVQNLRGELNEVKDHLEKERATTGELQNLVATIRADTEQNSAKSSESMEALQKTITNLTAQVNFLESDSKAQSDSFTEMKLQLLEAKKSEEISRQKLIKEETLRRILFNQVQELKGNIRVMCRVRPTFEQDVAITQVAIPDSEKESRQLELTGPEERSAMGTITRKTHAFAFDRVFGPTTQNEEVFNEISQLVQSALDGYNVCIFCYGQTGAGKTHTMSSADGMIPRATKQIYDTATALKDKGWTYSMEGSFVEVYNEELHDLLGSSKDFGKKKHEIRHDDQKKQTTVTGLKSVTLDSPQSVESILKQADANRIVAATKSNERSSRSHSVFILKLIGRNSTTNEICEGTLNLVDLAGSERLKQSGAEGDRMKETQNINKSLSCLGDVIGALGQGKENGHIPYRNSKLTYLLQYSLGGNSKTLMFVMVSPLEQHLKETLTSLKFATKVHNTHIGTAKKTSKTRRRSNSDP
ncbi:Kinesin-like protein klpA [Phlyctema vagabunda]|uniref:Kinesin-like protein klpA n=1 Tax=Phlyctema vagabunda TaxID=108571 RepID=A0ABR4PNZ4_9HELO